MVLDVRERGSRRSSARRESLDDRTAQECAASASENSAEPSGPVTPSGYRAPVSVSIVQSGADSAPVLGVAAQLTRGPARVMSAHRSSEPTSQTMIPPPFHEERGALEWSRRSRIL